MKMFIFLFIFYCSGLNGQDIHLCSITSEDNLIESFPLNLEHFGYTFWYKYQTHVQGDCDFIIFEEAPPYLNNMKFSFQVSLKNEFATHEFILQNRTFWNQQIRASVSKNQNYWHFFAMYYESGKFEIKIITSESIYQGINIWSLAFLKVIINRNLFYPQVRLTICGEQLMLKQKLLQFDDAEIQQFKDSLRQEITLEYSPDFKNFLSKQFNPSNAIISIWLKDSNGHSSFTLSLFAALTDLQNFLDYQNSDIYIDQLNYTYLTLVKFNQSLFLRTPENEQSISLQPFISNEDLSKWYFLKLDAEKHIEIDTSNYKYCINSSLQFALPNTQLQISVNNTVFASLQISRHRRIGCSPECLKCSDPFTCLQCKGNRISPYCECPAGTYDFGNNDCEFMHINLELTQVNTYNQTCPIGYLQCSEITLCSFGYTMYRNKCYKCPQLGDEICQQCIISILPNRLLCQYLSDTNLRRYSLSEIDETMFFLQQDIYDDQPYQILRLASISIFYQLIDDYGFKAINYENLPHAQISTQKPQCPYRYNLIFNFYDTDAHFCLKLPKNCLKLGYLESDRYQQCQLCQPKYSLIQNECIKCPEKCQSCSISQCTSCIDGYYLSYNGICKQCKYSQCQVCYEYTEGYLSIQDEMIPYSIKKEPHIYCAICNHGYEFNYQRLECQLSVQICEVAIYNQKQICLVGNNSEFISTSCLLNNCNQCFTNTCVRCAVGYYLQDSKCKECKFQYTLNSHNTFMVDCQLHDPINYSDEKQSLQHIYLLHLNTLHPQNLTEIQLKQCINGEILYDIAKCQPRNNVHHKLQGLCSFLILSNEISYCTEVNRNISGLVIDRLSGKVKYCNKYLACDIKKQYNMTLNILGQIEYKDMIFHNLGQYIESLDIKILQEQSITELDLHLTVQIQTQRSIVCRSELPINLFVYLSPQRFSILNSIRKLKIINCTFVNSVLFHNQNLPNNLSTYIFQSIQLSRIISNRSQIVDFSGHSFMSTQILIANLSIQLHKLDCSFIAIVSLNCKIYELGCFDTTLNKMPLLSVVSQEILLNNISISNSKKAFATQNDQQIFVPIDNSASFIILLDFIRLNLTDAYIGQFYVRYPIIKISSSQSKDILLKSVKFDQLQVFSSKIMSVSVNNIHISMMSFQNIWFHSLSDEASSQEILFECIGQTIFIYQLTFWAIKNTNSHYLQWIVLQGKNITIHQVLFQQFYIEITKFFHDGANQTTIDKISKQQGDNQLMYMLTESLIIRKLIIQNIETSNQFLIRLDSQKAIDKLDIKNMKIDANLDAQYLGMIVSSQFIKYVSISNLKSQQLKLIDALMSLKVNKILLIDNINLNLNSGGLLSCQTIDFTEVSLRNIDIHQSLNTLDSIGIDRVLISIYGGIVSIESVIIKKCISDVMYLKSFQSVQIRFLYILEAQAMQNLVLIQSQFCLSFNISDIFIFDHQLYDQKSNSNQGQLRNLITFKLNFSHQYIINNMVLNNNQDISSLMVFYGGNYFRISNFSIFNNMCQQICLISTNESQSIQQGRTLQQTQSNGLKFIDGVITGNNGTLFEFIVGLVKFNRLLIIHNGLIFNQFAQYQIIECVQESQLLYHSDHIIDLNSILMNNTFVMNEQLYNIQSINTIVLTLSFDGGNTQYLTINNTVVFYKNERIVKEYCYFPTGQKLGEYQRLNLQNYNYETFIKEMKFGLRGQPSETDLQCVLNYQNKQQTFKMNQQNWEDFTLIAQPQTIVKFQLQCTKYNLQFLVKVLGCQLGEIYLNSCCLRCDSNRNQYSVQRKSSQCLTITENIEQVQSGVIKLKPGYWRPYLTSSQIEQCPKQQICLGGWQVGDNSCFPGYIGALCSVCDIHSKRGHGNYVQNSWNQCELCRTRYSIIFYISIILIIQIILLYLNNKSWEDDCVQLRNNTLLVKHYRLLSKYYVDNVQITIKLFTNFLQQFLVITSTCYLGLPVFLKQVFYQYSNPSISIWQEVQCLYTNQFYSHFDIWVKPLIIVGVSMIVFNFYLFIHLTLIRRKMTSYQFRNLCVTFYYLIIFNYTNYYEILISLTSWRKISGLRWVNTNLSINYDKQEYIQNLFMFVLPQIAIFWIIPLIILKILKIKQLSLLKLKTYYYWGFLYKQFKGNSYNEEISRTWIQLTIITISYQLSNYAAYRLAALLLILVLYKSLQEYRSPYQFSNFNKLNINLQEGMIVLIILFSLLNVQESDHGTLIIYIVISLQLLILLKLILKQLLDSICRTYKNQLDNFKVNIINKVPQIENKFPALFKLSSVRLSYVRANFDKMRAKHLQLSRTKTLLEEASTKQCLISEQLTAVRITNQVEKYILQQKDLDRVEPSIFP